MTTIIPRNKTIPTEETLLFTTSEDDQKQVNVNVFQGERPKVRDNRKLDAFCVPLEPMPRGVPKIDITFKI
ncbi:Hsp70 family protein, partial [Klebsiella pneumoniae]|uniref:Hsp70 family protein n=1 Tax=Klebsiella pneumoniae TaxID=573 RepID=UPI003852C430